jgi:hypothetical protein
MGVTLGSYQGLPCHHWPEELPLIAAVLADYRPSLVVETGTMYGGFAAFLADTVSAWEGRVLTIDWEIYPTVAEAVATRRDRLQFLCADLLAPMTWEVVTGLTRLHHPTAALYCDGGAKRTEFKNFSDGWFTLVGVHDYGTEISPEDCAFQERDYGRLPVRAAEFEALQAAKGGYFVSRFWAPPSPSP